MIDISGHLRSYRRECGFEDNDNYLVVNCCGYQKFISKNYTINREKGRLDYQLLYIAKGSGLFKLGGNVMEAGEGNIVIYRPGEVQSYSYLCGNSPEVYWIHFTGFGVEGLIRNAGLLDVQMCFIGVSNKYIDIFESIMHELQIKKPLFETSVSSRFLELLTNIGRKKIENTYSSVNDKYIKLQKILELMHSSYSQKWNVHDFAKQCNLSTFRFIHCFKEYSGMSPIDYLIKIRIDKARELLNDSSLNICEIAEVLGYDNSLYFSRIFKKATGYSPRNYRNRIKG